ncbi:MAG: F0F1 ATP synthase subunit B [Alphaproteobacteria bacterium]
MPHFLEEAESWVAIAFVIFVLATFRPISRAIAGMLDSRSARIKEELDEAQRLREEAQHTLAEFKRKQRDVAKEAEEILDQAREEAEQIRAKAKEDLDHAMKRREELAMGRIAQAEAEATREVRERAVDIAVTAAGQVLQKRLEGEAGEKLIDDAIKDLSSKLH